MLVRACLRSAATRGSRRTTQLASMLATSGSASRASTCCEEGCEPYKRVGGRRRVEGGAPHHQPTRMPRGSLRAGFRGGCARGIRRELNHGSVRAAVAKPRFAGTNVGICVARRTGRRAAQTHPARCCPKSGGGSGRRVRRIRVGGKGGSREQEAAAVRFLRLGPDGLGIEFTTCTRCAVEVELGDGAETRARGLAQLLRLAESVAIGA